MVKCAPRSVSPSGANLPHDDLRHATGGLRLLGATPSYQLSFQAPWTGSSLLDE